MAIAPSAGLIRGGPGLLLLLLPSLAGAQSLGFNPDRDGEPWFRAWSPLEWTASLTRRIPAAGVPSLEESAPNGQFWTAGNPAALADEVTAGRTDFGLAWSRQSGAYRRPLDPGAARLFRLTARSWRRISPGFALLGNVVADQERLDPGTTADETEPYPTSPFMTTDTSLAPVRRNRVRLEGAGSWRTGAWGLGLALGIETRETQSIGSGLVRQVRGAMPGAVLGVTRALGTWTAGLHGRYRYRAETIRLAEASEEGRVYQLVGYVEPGAIDLLASYYRRIDESSSSGGGSAGGPLAGGLATVYAEAHWLAEGLTRQQQNDPAKDTWRASGWAAGFAWQRHPGPRWGLTVLGSAQGVSGQGDVYFDSAGVIFTATERGITGRAELRYGNGPWSVAAGAGVVYESRLRSDSAAGLRTRITSASPAFQVSLRRDFGAIRVLGGAALLVYIPTSELPDPQSQGPAYRRLIAPELDVYALSATPVALTMRTEWRVSTASTLWLAGRVERVSPSNGPLTPFSPGGSRSAAAFEGGITLR